LNKSEDFQSFKLSKPQEAAKIVAPKNIFKIKDYILTPTNDDFGIISFSIIHHLIFGTIQKETHLFVLEKLAECKIVLSII